METSSFQVNEVGHSPQGVCLLPGCIHKFTQQAFPEPPAKSLVLGIQRRASHCPPVSYSLTSHFPTQYLHSLITSGSPSPSIHLNIYWVPAICQVLDKGWGYTERGMRCELPGVSDTLANDSTAGQYEIRRYCENRTPTQSWTQKQLPEIIS